MKNLLQEVKDEMGSRFDEVQFDQAIYDVVLMGLSYSDEEHKDYSCSELIIIPQEKDGEDLLPLDGEIFLDVMVAESSSGNIVVEGGGYSFISGGQLIVETMTLEDGCYTFTIYDSYADGQFDGNMEGNYSLDCSIINAASGEGNWGASESTDFCVNP
jgi:hypothetical protein